MTGFKRNLNFNFAHSIDFATPFFQIIDKRFLLEIQFTFNFTGQPLL